MKSKYRYEIIIYWSDDDNAFIAEVPELPGCAADGQTYQEALAQAEVVIGEWIETAKELRPRHPSASRPPDIRIVPGSHPTAAAPDGGHSILLNEKDVAAASEPEPLVRQAKLGASCRVRVPAE